MFSKEQKLKPSLLRACNYQYLNGMLSRQGSKSKANKLISEPQLIWKALRNVKEFIRAKNH